MRLISFNALRRNLRFLFLCTNNFFVRLMSAPGDCFKYLCMKPTRCYLQSAAFDIKLTTGSGNAGTCENLHDRSQIRLRQKAGVCASALMVVWMVRSEQ